MSSLLCFILLGFIAFSSAGYGYEEEHEDYHAHPKYEFEYKVHDPHTGDIKEQKEHRDGDVVKGFYSLKEADGTTREVHYHSDKHSGFNAEVKKIGHAYHGHEYHGHGYP